MKTIVFHSPRPVGRKWPSEKRGTGSEASETGRRSFGTVRDAPRAEAQELKDDRRKTGRKKSGLKGSLSQPAEKIGAGERN